jgi:hypothetical protein
MCGHGVIAIKTRTHLNAFASAGNNLGKTPDGNAAFVFRRGEELPITHSVANGGVGDVIGSECKMFYLEQYLTVLQRVDVD